MIRITRHKDGFLTYRNTSCYNDLSCEQVFAVRSFSFLVREGETVTGPELATRIRNRYTSTDYTQAACAVLEGE